MDTFEKEINEAVKGYEKYIVCVNKTPDQCLASLRSLMEKAIAAFKQRAPNLRHGIALDREVTIILSQTEDDRPLCGIYFNLYSPYQKQASKKGAKAGENEGS